MRQPNYRHYLHLIQEQIKRNLTYSFAWLATGSPPDMPGKIWTINRKTLERARNSGELICCKSGTSVLGAWLLAWVNATEDERREFVNRKIYGRYQHQQGKNNGANKERIDAGHANA